MTALGPAADPPARERLTVRAATAADAAEMAELHVRSWQVAYAGILPGAELAALSIEDRRARWERVFASHEPADPRWITVALHGTRVVGFAGGGPCRDADGEGLTELYALYVAPEHWARGVGSALMVDALPRLRAPGAPAARLWVLEDNERARRFYEGHGWRPDGAREPQELLPGSAPQTVRYTRTLADVGPAR